MIYHVHSGIGAHEKMETEENNKLEETDLENEAVNNMAYKKRKTTFKRSKKGRVTTFSRRKTTKKKRK